MEPELKQVKDLVEGIGKAFEAFKQTQEQHETEIKKFGNVDSLLEEKMKKVTDDFTKHHDELNRRLDQLEAKNQRIGDLGATDEERANFVKEAKEFNRTVLLRKGALAPGQEVVANVEEYKAYKSTLIKFLVKGDKMLSQEEYKALSVGSEPDGGFLVRPEWATWIQKYIYETSPMRALCNIETISVPEFKIPLDLGEADCGWVAESGARNETTTPQIKEKGIMAHEMYALPKATQNILEDAAMDLEAWLSGKVAEKMARTEATAFVTGNGVGKPKGFTQYAKSATGDNSWGEIQYHKTGSTSGFVAAASNPGDCLLDLLGSLKEDYHAGSTWIMKRSSFPKFMQLKDAQGRYLFDTVFQNGWAGVNLLGYPVRYANDMPAISSGALFAAFGNFKRAYTIVDRLGIAFLRDPYMYKPFIGFYFRKRVGGDMVDFDAIKLLKAEA